MKHLNFKELRVSIALYIILLNATYNKEKSKQFIIKYLKLTNKYVLKLKGILY